MSTAIAPVDDVARALRDMGVAPHIAVMLARDPKRAPHMLAERRLAGRLDPVVRERQRPGPPPSVGSDVIDEVMGDLPRGRIAALARANGVAPRVLYGLRTRHGARRRTP